MIKKSLFTVISVLLCIIAFPQVFDHGLSFTSSENLIQGITIIDQNDNLIVGGYFTGQINVASDPNNEVFLYSGDGINAFISKYMESGELAWHIMLGNKTDVRIVDITTDEEGSIFVTGSFYNRLDFDPTRGTFFLNADERDGFWAKYSSDGLLLEAHKFGVNNYDTGLRVIVRKSEVFLVGAISESVFSNKDVFALKYSKTGDLIWTLSMPGLSMVDEIASIGIDREGDFYISGSFMGELTARMGMQSKSIHAESFHGFIIQVKENGSLGWIKNIGGDGNNHIRQMLVSGDDIYLAFNFTEQIEFEKESITYRLSSKGSSDNLFLCYSTLGQFNDFLHFGSDTIDSIFKVNFDNLNNILLTGHAFKPLDVNPNGDPVYLNFESDFGSGYVLCFNRDFNLIWSKEYASELAYSYCRHINVNTNNDIYISGHSYSEIDIDPGEGNEIIGVDGKRTYYISCLRPYYTNANIETFSIENAISTDVDSESLIVDVLMPSDKDVSNLTAEITLSEGATVNGEMPSDFSNPVELEVIAEDGLTSVIWTINVTVEEVQNSLFQTNSAKNIKVYPNPVSGMVNIKVQNSNAVNYKLISFNGAQIKQGRVVNGIVNLHAYPAGLYFLEIFNKDIHQTFKLYINE